MLLMRCNQAPSSLEIFSKPSKGCVWISIGVTYFTDLLKSTLCGAICVSIIPQSCRQMKVLFVCFWCDVIKPPPVWRSSVSHPKGVCEFLFYRSVKEHTMWGFLLYAVILYSPHLCRQQCVLVYMLLNMIKWIICWANFNFFSEDNS